MSGPGKTGKGLPGGRSSPSYNLGPDHRIHFNSVALLGQTQSQETKSLLLPAVGETWVQTESCLVPRKGPAVRKTPGVEGLRGNLKVSCGCQTRKELEGGQGGGSSWRRGHGPPHQEHLSDGFLQDRIPHTQVKKKTSQARALGSEQVTLE